MFDDSIRAYLKESRGMNDEKIEEFGKLYAFDYSFSLCNLRISGERTIQRVPC